MAAPIVAPASPTPEQLAFFELKIRPVLAQHCYQCHSAEALRNGTLKASLLVDSRAGMAKGGESGAAVVPKNKEESLLLAALQYDGFEMPPAGKLPDEVIADFETWIDMGAPDPRDEPLATIAERTVDVEAGLKHWSYRRLAPVSPPPVQTAGWIRNEIDRFVLAKQEEAGIAPAAEAPKATLARHVFFDLTGLPPSPDELKLFLDDASPGAHHYRDWVIKALNADLPYDEFLRMQVAGDLTEPGDYDAMAATGFLVAGPYPGQVTAKTVEPIRCDQLDDMVATLGSSVLGTTIGCARCHDHKYDPIGQRAYYAMIACLGKAVQHDTDVDLDPATTKKKRDAWLAERAPVAAAHDRFRRDVLPGRIARWLAVDARHQVVESTWMSLDPQQITAA